MLPQKHFQLVTLGRLALHGASVDETELGKRPRKLALLALLATSRRPPTRERLVEMFWGGEAEERARHSLSDALSHIRRVLGRGSVGTRARFVELEVAGVLAVDAVEFESACEALDFQRAIALYGGPFLGDFHLAGSVAFDDWAAAARARYARMFAHACETHCDLLLGERRFDECVVVAARWLEEEPDATVAVAALLRSATASSDPLVQRRALDDYQAWATRRDAEESVPADRQLVAMAAELARALASRAVQIVAEPGPSIPDSSIDPNDAEPIATSGRGAEPPATAAPALAPTSDRTTQPIASPVPARRSRWTWAGLAAAAALVLAIGLVINTSVAARPLPLRPVIALVDFRADASDSSLAWLGEGLKEMIAAELSRVPETDVIPPSLTRDVHDGATARAPDGSDASLAMARNLHATIAVSARVSRNEGAYVVLVAMQNVDGRTDAHRFTATGKDILAVADEVAARISSTAMAGAAGPRLSDVETSNTEAFRHFVRGRELLDEGRDDEAGKELDLAIAADSMFTSAIVARLHAKDPAVYIRVKPLFDRVRTRLTEWDRMSEAVYDAYRGGDNARAEVLAQELEQRFPRDPRAIAQVAEVYQSHGRFTEAERAYLRLLALDSLGVAGRTGPCAPCVALSGIASVRAIVGDSSGARIAAKRLTELRPGSPGAWVTYGTALSSNGSTDEALIALHRGHELLGDSTLDVFTARALVQARRYDRAEALARPFLGSSSDIDARDILSTVHRERGQYRASAAILDLPEWKGLELVRASSLAASGQAATAARVFQSRFFNPGQISAGGLRIGARLGDEARAFSWEHALEADAIWEHADTIVLNALADSVQVIGARSYYARDWQLAHHIRGLVAIRGGRLADAERELQAAMARFPGWTRTNLHLARVQIMTSHPERAIPTLRRAYREPLDAMGRYAPRTDLDFEMARAFHAMGRADSAAVYAGRVRSAWAHAEPETARRLASLP